MGRQRMVRPELFVHEDLFAAETKAGLPLRLAYIGLWTQCDREGRFEWRPSRLKLAILPWDGVDFGNVLDELADAGFVTRYEVDGKSYGFIPSWHRHQKPHHQEAKSVIPPPPTAQSDSHLGAKSLGDSPNGFAPSPEPLRTLARSDSPENEDGNKDGDGIKVEDGAGDEDRNTSASADGASGEYPPEFESFWQTYPRKAEKRRAFKAWKVRCKEGTQPEAMILSAKNYAATCAARRTETRFVKLPATFIGPDRPFEDWLNPIQERNDHESTTRTGASNRGQQSGSHRYDPALDPHSGQAAGESNTLPGHDPGGTDQAR